MITPLLRYHVLRGLGGLQILAAFALGLAVVVSHNVYKTSLGSILPASTASLSATAEVLSDVARDVQDNQVILETFTTTLGSYTDLAAQSKASVQNMTDLLPKWNKTVSDLSNRTRDISAVMNSTADKMKFSVPSGLEFQGFTPKLTWSVPLQAQAEELHQVASQTADLGRNIDSTWDAFATNATAMSQAFVATCDKTTLLLNQTRYSVAKLRKEDLGPATTRLNDAAAGLRTVAQGVTQTTPFVDSLFYLGLALAASVGISGLSILFTAARPNETQSEPERHTRGTGKMETTSFN